MRSGGGIQRESEELTPAQLRTERLGLQLRTRAGLPLDILTGDARDRARSLEDHGLATIDRDRIVLTPRGRLVADSIAVELM